MSVEDMVTSSDYTSSVTLVITGENITPDEVTTAIGLTPYKTWKKGGVRRFESEREFVYPWSGWKLLMDDKVANQAFEEQLAYWCTILLPKKDVIDQVTMAGMNIYLECYLSFGGQVTATLDRALLEKLTNIGVNLSFNIFHFEE